MMFCVFSTHHVTSHLTYRNKLQFDLKSMKMKYQKYRKMQFCIQLYFDIWEIILYLQANPCRFKTKILIASFLLAPLLND